MTKLKKAEHITTTTYLLKGGFYVDIVHDERKHMYYAWMGHYSVGVKDFMFGGYDTLNNGDVIAPRDFKAMVEGSVDNEIELFREFYFD